MTDFGPTVHPTATIAMASIDAAKEITLALHEVT
jgi:hypothetical protein